MSWSTDLRDSHKLGQCHFKLFQLKIFWFCRKAKQPINYKNCSLVARMVISVKEVTQCLHSHTCLLSRERLALTQAQLEVAGAGLWDSLVCALQVDPYTTKPAAGGVGAST